ncbi:MAG: DUF3299 domain-containing protein [Burkholderiaceae bacterium]|nr:DUF3299 domain-containing protein [Burkholderiaceae bacterium]
MSTKFKSKFVLGAMALALMGTWASAQLSAPVAGVPVSKSLGAVPAGTGAGVHSPNSPFAPLPARVDVVSWNVLTDVKIKAIKGNILPVFNASQMALNQRSQRIQGFMMPLDPGEKQTHFLLSSVPLTCGFCTPGGPESMVEVKTKTPVKYTTEPVVVEGYFQVLVNDPFGVYYRIADATPVK